jgi:hypothetical protein
MTDQDIHAFGPPLAAAAPRHRRRLWPWLLGAALIVLVLVAAAASALLMAVADGVGQDISVVINGERWNPVAFSFGQAWAGLLGLGLGLCALMLVLLVVLPSAVLLGLLAAALGLGIALLAVALVAAVALSPLWLTVWLLWLLLRRTPPATMRG